MVLEAGSHLACTGGAYRRAVDEQRSGGQSLDQPVGAEQDFGHLRRVGHAGDDHVTGARHLTRAARFDGSERQERPRLASKRLRYTLELFRPCYPPGLEDRLDALKVLQDRLGEVNDAVATAEMLRGALKHQPKVRKFLEERAAEHAAGFARHWKETFDAPGQEAWWTGFLARPVK